VGDLRDRLTGRQRWAVTALLAVPFLVGALGAGGVSAASPGLTLQSVTVDYPSSHWSPTWTYNSPDPGGTAMWDTSIFTNT
jgi:hypothetical protein